jgi:hypothetical protein
MYFDFNALRPRSGGVPTTLLRTATDGWLARLTRTLKLTNSQDGVKQLVTTRTAVQLTRVLDGLAA